MRIRLVVLFSFFYLGWSFGQIGFESNVLIESPAISIFAMDIDGDNDKDIVAGNLSAVYWIEHIDGQGTFGPKQNIGTGNESKSLFAIDIDGDGDIDVVSCDGDDKVVWYKNIDGLGNFSSENIISTDINGAGRIFAIDIDGDNDIDIVSTSEFDDRIIWYENLDGEGSFSAEKIVAENISSSSIFVIDVDGDMDNDIVSTGGFNKIAWFENLDGQGNFSIEHIIATTVESPMSTYASDMDNDGDIDVLSASSLDGKVNWYENLDGQGDFGIEQTVFTDVNIFVPGGPMTVAAHDLDWDGDKDILYSNTTKIYYFENIDGLGTFSSVKLVSNDPSRQVIADDMDVDGNMDVLYSYMSISFVEGEIGWHRNLGLLNNKIVGNVQFDSNFNGCDSLDYLASNISISTSSLSENLSTSTFENGFYQFHTDEGDYITSVTVPNYVSANPISNTSIFIGTGNIDTLNFCLTANQTINDLNISLYPIIDARPGFDATYQLVYHNVGTTQLNGTTTLEFNDTKLNFLTANEPITSQNNNTLTFDFENLNPFETRTIDLTFNVLPPPTVNIDDLLNFTATINPIAGDFTEDDNIFTFNQTVIGSYDPNDIRVLEGEEVLIENADQYLHYIIRFQNTGTASAINVRVENILDEKLDWNTIQLESYSHPNRVEIKDGNEVSFIFDGIYLPDSTTNEPESNGFIAYKIKPKSDIAIGDIISSTADIFFDFNEAVVTNTVMTEIVDPTSIKKDTQLRFSIFPIPTSGILMVQSESTIAEIEIYDQLGQLVLTKSNTSQIDLSTLNRGFYFCKVRDEKGDFGIKKVVKE